MNKKYYLRLTIEIQESPDKLPEVMDDFHIEAKDFHQWGALWRMLVQLMDMLAK